MKMTYWLNSNRGFIVCVGTYDLVLHSYIGTMQITIGPTQTPMVPTYIDLWCLHRNIQRLHRHKWCLHRTYRDTYGAYLPIPMVPAQTPISPTPTSRGPYQIPIGSLLTPIVLPLPPCTLMHLLSSFTLCFFLQNHQYQNNEHKQQNYYINSCNQIQTIIIPKTLICNSFVKKIVMTIFIMFIQFN